jgi:hypothetical protein
VFVPDIRNTQQVCYCKLGFGALNFPDAQNSPLDEWKKHTCTKCPAGRYMPYEAKMPCLLCAEGKVSHPEAHSQTELDLIANTETSGRAVWVLFSRDATVFGQNFLQIM